MAQWRAVVYEPPVTWQIVGNVEPPDALRFEGVCGRHQIIGFFESDLPP
jgi:hypothetical protein